MNNFFKQVWRDPVFSKVISAGFIAIFTLLTTLVISLIQKTSYKETFIKFWTSKIELWVIVSIILVLFLLFLAFRKLKNYRYDTDTLKLDRDLFIRIRDKLLTDDMMLEPRGNAFSSNPFKADSLHNILDIRDENKKAGFEFLNPVLEKKKQNMVTEVHKLGEVTSEYIFGTRNGDWLSIPREWAHDQRERFDQAWKSISAQENRLVEKYDDFIKTSRRILKV